MLDLSLEPSDAPVAPVELGPSFGGETPLCLGFGLAEFASKSFRNCSLFIMSWR